MTRNTSLKILNPILGILLLNQIATALLHDALPHEVFEIMHEGGGTALATAAVLHVILNWNWVKATFLGSKPTAKSQMHDEGKN